MVGIPYGVDDPHQCLGHKVKHQGLKYSGHWHVELSAIHPISWEPIKLDTGMFEKYRTLVDFKITGSKVKSKSILDIERSCLLNTLKTVSSSA